MSKLFIFVFLVLFAIVKCLQYDVYEGYDGVKDDDDISGRRLNNTDNGYTGGHSKGSHDGNTDESHPKKTFVENADELKMALRKIIGPIKPRNLDNDIIDQMVKKANATDKEAFGFLLGIAHLEGTQPKLFEEFMKYLCKAASS